MMIFCNNYYIFDIKFDTDILIFITLYYSLYFFPCSHGIFQRRKLEDSSRLVKKYINIFYINELFLLTRLREVFKILKSLFIINKKLKDIFVKWIPRSITFIVR